MKVLLTGARGFLGGAVRNVLTCAGYEVIAVARTAHEGCVAVDLEAPEAVTLLLRKTKPDVVVNCAARVDFNANVLSSLFSVNVLMPALIAEWCHSNDAYLVQASTVVVHGAKSSEAGRSTPTNPDTDYARSKLLAEQNIDQAGGRAVILRFGGVFGRSGPEHLGLNRALRGAMAGKPPRVVGSADAKRNYVFVHDAAAVVAHCLQSRPQGVRWVGGSQSLSIREMLETVCDVYLPGVKPEVAPGLEAMDQIVRHSSDLPAGRSFRAALEYERAQ